ncbi:PAS domain S-box protein [Stenotrophomonas sp.]|uniref:PAS domain S-box protein n=1 Tax=Stenotrophomonas sp. TaxID=69392 RepID=UPI0028AAADCA|nr:PAS domain S-box protein [Stenotrophomonas sp.]
MAGRVSLCRNPTPALPAPRRPAMSYTPDNAKLLNALQNVMVISTTDLQGNITYANDLFCTLTGFTREELIGQPHSIVRHPDVPKAVYKDMRDTIRASGVR